MEGGDGERQDVQKLVVQLVQLASSHGLEQRAEQVHVPGGVGVLLHAGQALLHEGHEPRVQHGLALRELGQGAEQQLEQPEDQESLAGGGVAQLLQLVAHEESSQNVAERAGCFRGCEEVRRDLHEGSAGFQLLEEVRHAPGEDLVEGTVVEDGEDGSKVVVDLDRLLGPKNLQALHAGRQELPGDRQLLVTQPIRALLAGLLRPAAEVDDAPQQSLHAEDQRLDQMFAVAHLLLRIVLGRGGEELLLAACLGFLGLLPAAFKDLRDAVLQGTEFVHEGVQDATQKRPPLRLPPGVLPHVVNGLHEVEDEPHARHLH
mmetsp:Transcript_22387/g.62878  ORF Transcript_22387/g.62878 Transcript_22387/m.62878 type:complete len:317 (-) Transcript_22387:603-1553(-)